jgi:hypothetical protein
MLWPEQVPRRRGRHVCPQAADWGQLSLHTCGCLLSGLIVDGLWATP